MTSSTSLRSCDIILGDFSHTPLVLYAIFRLRMSHIIGILDHKSCIRLQNGTSGLRRRSARGTLAQRNVYWLAMMIYITIQTRTGDDDKSETNPKTSSNKSYFYFTATFLLLVKQIQSVHQHTDLYRTDPVCTVIGPAMDVFACHLALDRH